MDELTALGTINAMSEDLYFYTAPDGSVTGPATLDQIQMDLQDGMLRGNAQISRGGNHPWVPLAEVIGAIEKGRNEPAPVKAVATKATAPSQKSPARTGTASALSIIGGVSIFLGAATTLVAFMEAKTMLGAMGLSCLMTGFLFLGFAECLDRLREISEKLNRKA